jgi:DNA/RNA endonuclease G (NUC1)
MAASHAPAVVVSQVYGGGGNAGSVYTHDFVELFNPGSAAVSLDGWSVQYASSTGSSWNRTVLSGSIPAGGYYLVRQAAGAGGTTPLPAPDAVGAANMSATAGKIALSNDSIALTAICPVGASVVDKVGFGGTNCATDWTSNTPTLSNPTAAVRNGGGCAYTGSPAADFSVINPPTPRNSATALNPCEDGEEPPTPVAVTVEVTPASDTLFVGQNAPFAATARDDANAVIGAETFTWTSLDPAIVTVSTTGQVTGVAVGSTQIVALASSAAVADTAAVLVVALEDPPESPDVRITEIHYDNVGTDVDEQVEIQGPAGVSVAGWSLALYNQTGGALYSTIALSGTFADLCDGSGVLVFATPAIQNGPADGLALVAPGGVVIQFLSYEGTLQATNGPAAGLTSTDIGVEQVTATPLGRSLQRAPSGAWYGPATSSFGACNGEAPPPPPGTILITGRLSSDPALPVGYQDQLFGTLRDGDGNTVVSAMTWSSDSPAIASIDADGVFTALAAGTAILRATADEGTTSTISLPTAVATQSATANYAGNAEFGEPADGDASDDEILRYPQFTASFNRLKGIPNWVSYAIEATHFGPQDRCDCFTYDEALPAAFTRYNTANYTGAGAYHGYGIDRGHLARSFDRTAGELDNARTYLFSNIVPQAADVNQGPWALFENYLGDFARLQNKEVYVVTGASGSKGTVKDEGIITIPAHNWKAAVIVDRDVRLADITSLAQMQVVAVAMPNDPGVRNAPWQQFAVTVDSVEALSGYDLLALLRDDLEIAVESNTRPPVASVAGTLTGIEGVTLIALSGAGSSDPDGDALEFAWAFGDGASATGVSASHIYAQDGAYNVRLIVTDVLGLADTLFAVATIANATPQITPLPSATLLAGETYVANGSFTDSGALDPWSASADFGDGHTAAVSLSGMTWALSHVYATAGTFTVRLEVSDDDVTAAVSATVRVWSTAEGVGAAASLVDAMVAGGTLSSGEGSSLGAKLGAASAAIARGQDAVAENQLRAALDQLTALERSGRLTATQASTLRDLLTRLIAALG